MTFMADGASSYMRWCAGGNGEDMRLSAAGGLSIGSTTDAGAGNLLVNGSIQFGTFTVATLPAGTTGKAVNCSNVRVSGEGAGLGTGGLVSYNTSWKVAGTNVVAAA